ncbi:hypothetical protein DCC79_03580 [bacterium]|nr:hypothetical protein [Chloroflexi bacterium CFX6]RIL11838.1 MAG: hypothetical protein DCC79_03580 [bacterium]
MPAARSHAMFRPTLKRVADRRAIVPAIQVALLCGLSSIGRPRLAMPFAAESVAARVSNWAPSDAGHDGPAGIAGGGQLGGAVRAVAAVGDGGTTIVAGMGPRVVAYDVSSGREPRLVSTSGVLGGIVENLAAAYPVAVATMGAAGWCVLDVAVETAVQVAACGSDGEGAYGVAVVGGRAFVAAGAAGLRVLDISTPRRGREVGRVLPTGVGDYRDVHVVGEYAYVADAFEGLLVFDVRAPAAPRLVGHLATGRKPSAVTVDGTRAYVLHSTEPDTWLAVVDVVDPAAPKILNRIFVSDSASDVFVVGGVAYVTDTVEGLVLVDVRDPSAPYQLGHLHPGGDLRSVVVEDGKAVVGSGASGLAVIDVADVKAPKLVSTYATALTVFAQSGPVLYGVDPDTGALRILEVGDTDIPREIGAMDLRDPAGATVDDIAVDGEMLYAALSSKELVIVDVAEPRAPRLVRRVEIADRAYSLAAAGGALYVATDASGVLVYNIGGPEAPAHIATVPIQHATDTAVQPPFLYVGSRDGLYVVDVTTPSMPASRGRWITEPATVDDITISKGRAYTTGSGDGFFVRFAVVDIHDPDRPALLDDAALPVDVGSYKVRVSGDFAFVTASGWGAYVYDLREPKRIEEVGVIDVEGTALDLALAADRLYISDSDAGIRVFDVAGLQPPMLLATEATVGDAVSVDVSSRHAYVAGGAQGLSVVDVSVADHPVLTAHLPIPGISGGIDVEGDFAYVASGPTGLSIVDVSTPSRPVLVTQINPSGAAPGGPHWASDVQVRDGHAYVACYPCGLWILNVADPRAPRYLGQLGEVRGGRQMLTVAIENAGQDVYLAGTDGLTIVDAGDVTAPRVMGELRSIGTALDLAVDDHRVHIALAAGAVATVDVADPERPALLGQLRMDGLAHAVTTDGPRVHVITSTGDLDATGGGKLWTVDAAPAALRVVREVAIAGHPTGLARHGTSVLVASRDGGLWVMGATGWEQLLHRAFVPMAARGLHR